MIFYHLCEKCNEKISNALTKDGWKFLRGGEPVSCNECSLQCELTVRGLWGEVDEVRYEICGRCADLDSCALKGRYYC